MLYNQLYLHSRYNLDSPEFRASFDFLQRKDLAELAEGEYPICHGVTAYIQLYTTSPKEQLRFETHEKYFDIQYVVTGQEGIGVLPKEGLTEETAYDAQKDIQFWQEPEYAGMVVLHPGDYAVLPPEMAHKPRISLGENCSLRKVVVKVPAVPRTK